MKKNICAFYCFMPAFLAGVVGTANAGIRVGNLSRNYAGTSKNYLAAQQQYYNATIGAQQQAAAEAELPVRVADAELAEQVRRGDANADTDMSTLNKCAMIYPDGEFVWDTPTLGRNAGGPATCVAVVEMRALNSSGGLEYATVARGKLAAGDSINCNISRFPASSYLPALASVEFPADSRPTREDVIKVMNEEQKSKAGLKIAAAALAAGIAGNMVGKNAPGEDSVFGTNSEKLKTTAGGILLGGGLMAASTYSGKVAGDTILQAGVNAAAGGVVGNMLATGNSVLRIEKCTHEGRKTSCLWGTITETDENNNNTKRGFYDAGGRRVILCEQGDGGNYINCQSQYNYIVKVIGDVPFDQFEEKKDNITKDRYSFDSNDARQTKLVPNNTTGEVYLATVAEVKSTKDVVIVDFQDSAFGKKQNDFRKWKAEHQGDVLICRRDNKGNPNCTDGNKYDSDKLADFTPSTLDADDGDVVDLSNKARLGSTLKGAGAGAAIGGFAGYQGAQSDIEERFVQATREYNTSLENFYCGTGRKFLSFYNDEAFVPAMNQQ
jgi:hypothetical protein